ncbi:RNA polymerase sigma factor [Pedobacter nyackensis]|uniref:Sigma-70 region 2 n=1 Tax=Pedobacter nyackensis TaxID=475255 RepID=A0A1W2F4T6_9SPHI|nr:sigma-70 family RNA polymerase sigma factor [Pedobacter nyackensis]SMD16923.1 Sigma-70 region 2 [Pedobacter nyackensis]
MKLKRSNRNGLGYEKLPDLELVGLLKLGNHTAFEEIYLRYKHVLYNYIYRKLQDKGAAEDVIHDVYFNLWKSKEDFMIGPNLSGYLFRATLNGAFGRFRHQKCIRQHEGAYKEPINTSSTDYIIRTNESSKLIGKAINALPVKMKEVFLLRHNQGLNNKQIAAKLSLSEHTVASQIKYALRILRAKLNIVTHPGLYEQSHR